MANLLPHKREYGRNMAEYGRNMAARAAIFSQSLSRTRLNSGFASGNIADHYGSSDISTPERERETMVAHAPVNRSTYVAGDSMV